MCILLNVGSYFFKTCPNTRSETTKLCHFMFCFLHFSETFNRAGQCQNVKTFWNLFFQQVLKSGKFWKKITVPDFKVNLLNSFYWVEIFFIIQWRGSFRKIPDFTKIFWLFQNFSKMPLDLPNCFLLWSINDAAAAELSVSIIFVKVVNTIWLIQRGGKANYIKILPLSGRYMSGGTIQHLLPLNAIIISFYELI